MIFTLITIIIYSSLTILSLFLIGFGLTQLLIPSTLKKYSFWLTPWFGAFFLIFTLVTSSLAGISVKQISPFVILTAIILDIIVFIQKKTKISFELKQEMIIALFIGISIVLNTSPLIRRDRFLTSLSLGNNDIIAYVTSADYLKNHTIIESFNTTVSESVGNLLQAFYRFGPPIIGSFFLNLFQLDGYQFIYLLETILFALTLPLLYVFLKLINVGKNNIFSLIFLMIITAFNVNLLYILYHDFFGQTLFWSIQMFLLIFLFSYLYDKNDQKNALTKYDYILGVAIAVFYFIYHEPAIFIFAPLVLFVAFSFLIKKNIVIYLKKFMKIGLIAVLSGSISISYAMIFDFKLAFRSNPNQPIGWELFRAKIPFANPYEAIGFYSIHSFAPLPFFIALTLSILTIAIIIYGLLKTNKKLLTFSYLLIFLIFYYWLGIYHHNFFVYNRALTYTLPVWLVLFTIGITHIFDSFKKSILFKTFICFLIGLEIFSGIKLNKRFISGRLSIDQSYVSLVALRNKNIKEPIYIESFVNDKVPLWKQNWLGYFIYSQKISVIPSLFDTNQFENKVPDGSLLLLSKPIPWVHPPNIILKDVIWSNDYFQLGHICNSEDCLLQSKKDLSNINIGKNDYEDSLLISGWESTEENYRWTSSQESTLRLIVKDKLFSKITIEAVSLKEPQKITIYIDDKLTGEIFVKTTWQSYSLPIDSGIEKGVHKIKFIYSNEYIPSNIIPGNLDNRTLYVKFKRIAFE